MASESPMKIPICLVENWNEQLTVNSEALRILEKICQPVVVVAIVGTYRTGKSYLMNHLAGQNYGECGLGGSTVRAETKGIWMWCVPHPSKPNDTLVLLDTEGLGDVEKGDPKNDFWIFVLAVLLGSTFVYKSMGTIDHHALEQLHYVTELTQLIRAKSDFMPDEVEDSIEFVSFFPDFVWTVRDFMMELRMDGHPITEDEYLENALKLISGKSEKIQNSNKSRECIRCFFPKQRALTHLLSHIDKVPQNQLERNFQVQLKNFCSYVFTNAKTKTLGGGIIVTGNPEFLLSQKTIPCLKNAVTTLAQCENSAALQKAADHYSEQMAQRVQFPTDTLQELLEVHTACEREAITVFMEHSFKDDKQEFQKKLVDTIERKKEALLLQNEEASLKFCWDWLMWLLAPLMQSISRGAFSVPGGHGLLSSKGSLIPKEFLFLLVSPGKGGPPELPTSTVCHRKSIVQSDKALTKGEKAIAEERAKKEAAEKEQELLRQQQKEQQERMEAQERKRENILREQERVLEHKLKKLFTEGFKEKSEALTKEINLREEIETCKKKTPLIFSQILDIAPTVFLVIVPGTGKTSWGRDENYYTNSYKIRTLHL
uniref:GB1/RHD3-type G domain-containing protein n=1 Tax=Marmota marmota marmota TaxID=9994 RepID=A0A8C5YZH6_MARMA